jgi:hypothetical protein
MKGLITENFWKIITVVTQWVRPISDEKLKLGIRFRGIPVQRPDGEVHRLER